MASQDIHPLSPTGTTTDINTGSEQGVKQRMTDIASQAKTTAADWGRAATTRVDQNLRSAAGALENTASAIRERVPATGKVNELGTKTADTIESTARYLREHDTHDMVAGVETLVRRNPGASLAAALAVGFLIGTAMRKDNDYRY